MDTSGKTTGPQKASGEPNRRLGKSTIKRENARQHFAVPLENDKKMAFRPFGSSSLSASSG
jgi:hypothetical protein